jgi:hypothetical protein
VEGNPAKLHVFTLQNGVPTSRILSLKYVGKNTKGHACLRLLIIVLFVIAKERKQPKYT